MRRRLVASYVALTTLVLLIVLIPLGITLARDERLRLAERLEREVALVTGVATDGLHTGDLSGFRQLAERYAGQSQARVVLVDHGGEVLGGAGGRPEELQVLADTAQVRDALDNRATEGLASLPVGGRVAVAALPVTAEGAIVAAVGLAEPTAAMDRQIVEASLILAAVGLAGVGLAAAVGMWLARSFTRPVSRLHDAATQLGDGELGARVGSLDAPVELSHLGATMDDMAMRLERLVEAQDRFVADASHELRTPLTAIRLRLENLQPQVDEETADELSAVIADTDRLSRLVQGLLTLARGQAGTPPREAVDVRAALRERQRLWGALADEDGVRLTAEVRPTPLVWALPGAVEQALDNLIANALSATPSGREVRLRVEVREPWVELHVVDEGPGMREDDRRRAFDRFWRQSTAASGGGSGLGLAIVRQLVEGGGGEVELLPADGGGIDAVVRLPPVATP